jgi:hypothetical protein
MTDDAKPKTELEVPRNVWVRGGTTSGAHDRQVQKQVYDDEQRRKQQEATMRAQQTGVLPEHLRDRELQGDAPGTARMSSMRLGGTHGHASIVLGLKHPKDGEILDWIICELIVQPNELILNMACPRCAASGEADRVRDQNIKVHQTNRMFWLDTKRQGEIWVNPKDANEHYILAGTVTSKDWMTCPNRGCGWRFRIDDSVVYTA